MITITKEFTKEQLIEQAKKNIEVLRVAVERVPGAYDAAVIHLKLAEITLASLEAEPIAWECGENIILFNPDTVEAYAKRAEITPKPLFAVPPVPVILADVAQAIEKLKRKLVECNRYNYCADAVKGVEDACRAVSYSHADNQPASGNQAAESNRGNEWTGNPDIDNAIIMLDRIDTLESCDDDRIEAVKAVKAVLRRLAGNYPVTPDGWISCGDRMPEKGQNVLISVNFDSSLVEPLICSARYTGSTFRRGDATIRPGNGIEQATHWMPLPEPPQEVNRG